MKVRFTAEIIGDKGNVVGSHVSEEGGIPSPDEFGLSTKEGFLRDFDSLEKAIFKARNQMRGYCPGSLGSGLKNGRMQGKEADIESELGRIPSRFFDGLAAFMQSKERIYNIAYLLLSSKICTKLSYRDATEMINLFFHRNDRDSIKLRTLSDSMDRIGGKISDGLENIAGKRKYRSAP